MKEKDNRPGFPWKLSLVFHVFILVMVSNITAFKVSPEESDRDKAHPANTETYYNKKYDFSIRFPSDWEVQKDLREGGVLVTFVALSPLEGQDDRYHDLVMVSVPKRKTRFSGGKDFEQLTEAERKSHLEDFSKGFVRGLSSDGDSFKIERQGFDEIDKRMTMWIVASGRLAEMEITTLAYFFCIEKRAYTISCMAQSKDFESYRKTFEETAKSFKFETDEQSNRK